MVKEWSFSISFLFISFILFSQDNDKVLNKKGLSFKAQSLILSYYEKNDTNISPYQTDFELSNSTFLYGINTELNYYFSPYFATGLGFGVEQISQPNIVYMPLYINAIGLFNSGKKSLYSKLNFGIHLGDIDNLGFLFRFGLGGRFVVFKKIASNIEVTYSFQNIDKTFNNSNRPENYYNIESIGITIGIEIN
jgi:hypothetical protein